MRATQLIKETRESLAEGLLTLHEANIRLTKALGKEQCSKCEALGVDCIPREQKWINGEWHTMLVDGEVTRSTDLMVLTLDGGESTRSVYAGHIIYKTSVPTWRAGTCYHVAHYHLAY